MRHAIGLLLAFLMMASGGSSIAVQLEIDSEPAGFDAWADGRYLGRTPLTATLSRGETNLRLAEPSYSLYRAPVVDTVLNLGAADTLRILFRVPPLVSIRSRPFGLPLLKDGRRIGSTPLSLRLDPGETERLELVTPGGLVAVESESLRARRHWLWVGDESALRASTPSGQSRLHRIGKHLMPAVALMMAAGGMIAEDQADRAYRQYQRAADPAAIQARYDSTRRRDRLAAAFWITAEIAAASAVIAWILPDDGRPSVKEPKR